MTLKDWTRSSMNYIEWGADTRFTHRKKDLTIYIGISYVTIEKNNKKIYEHKFDTRKQALAYTRAYMKKH